MATKSILRCPLAPVRKSDSVKLNLHRSLRDSADVAFRSPHEMTIGIRAIWALPRIVFAYRSNIRLFSPGRLNGDPGDRKLANVRASRLVIAILDVNLCLTRTENLPSSGNDSSRPFN
jgi:hypothetical protein